MEFEDQEEIEEEMEMGPSYDSLPNSNSTRLTKIPSPVEMSAEPTSQRKPRYRECLKNHAVGIGGHAVDGCGEFLPAGAEGTLDALKCAACNCHRNFHRKEAFPGAAPHDPFHFLHHHHHHYQQPPQPQQLLTYRTPSGYVHVSPPLQPRPLALPSTSSRGDQQEDTSKKRHRTKFSQEQKEKMLELAEKMGWKMQKQDEEIVQQFCNESGIKRNVFKVWMHNNKSTLGRITLRKSGKSKRLLTFRYSLLKFHSAKCTKNKVSHSSAKNFSQSRRLQIPES